MEKISSDSERFCAVATPKASRICTAMMRLGTRMAALFDAHFAPYKITQAQFRALASIGAAGEGGISPSELAQALLLERATVTVTVARLIEAGWVERREGANRRTYQLVLTQEGNAQFQMIVPLAGELAEQTLQGLSEDEVHQFYDLLEHLDGGIRTLNSKVFSATD